MLAARERRDEPRALLVRAEGEDRQRHRARVDRDGDADARVGARKLFEDEDVGKEVRAGAAVLFGDAGAHQPELGEVAEELARESVLTVPPRRVRLDLLRAEVARERLDLALLGSEVKIHPPRDISRGVLRLWLALAVLFPALLAGCGSTPPSPESVVRAWSQELNAGDNQAAAKLFAPGAEVIQAGTTLRLDTQAQAVAWNAALPCSGTIVSIKTKDDTTTATFVLGDRRERKCNGPG